MTTAKSEISANYFYLPETQFVTHSKDKRRYKVDIKQLHD
jgi:hypothetical protein